MVILHTALVLRRDRPAWDLHLAHRSRARGELRYLVSTELRTKSNSRWARMSYTPQGYAKDVVARHGVELVGWPAGIPFRNFSHIPGGLRPLQELLALWKRGVLRFERVSPEVRRRALRDPMSVFPNAPRPPPPPPGASKVASGTKSKSRPAMVTMDAAARVLPGSLASIPTPHAPTIVLRDAVAPAPGGSTGSVVRALVLGPGTLAPMGTHPTSTQAMRTKAPRAQRADFGGFRRRPVTNPLGLPLRRPKRGVKSTRYVLEDASGTRFWPVDDPIEEFED